MRAQQQNVGAREGRRLTLLFIGTGGIFTFLVSSIGALMLASQSGVRIPFNLSIFESNPYLQIFGFLSEFVMGVAYSILPLFKSKELPSKKAAYSSYMTITTANLLILVASLSQGSLYAHYLFDITSLLVLASSIIFALQTFRTLGDPSKFLGEAEPFMFLSSLSLVLISIIFLAQETGIFVSTDLFSPGFLYLSLMGFPGSMIFGVQLRTVAFRMTNYRKDFAKILPAFQGLSIGFAFAASFLNLKLLDVFASLFFLAAAILFVITIKVLERIRARLPLGSAVGGGSGISIRNKIFTYSNICTISSSLWLLFGCLLGVLWILPGVSSTSFSFLIRDSFIHSLAIGFIGSTIISYAPVLLPGVLSRKAPSESLSLWPIILLNAGIILRDSGNLYSSATDYPLPIWEALSGVLIISAMILFMKSLHMLKNR